MDDHSPRPQPKGRIGSAPEERTPRRGAFTRGKSLLRLHAWNDRRVLGLTIVSFASGFGQFGAVSALGDVAKSLGQVVPGATIADQAGLSGTTLGIGLAVLRLASLAGLPIAALADRFGRRRTILSTVYVGLGLTALAAISPSYWWFVAIFACGRPFLSATNALASVGAAEETGSSDRAKAVALIAAGYGVGAGLTAIIHGLGLQGERFRILFALALVPLVLVVVLRHWIHEPDRFVIAAASAEHPLPVLGAIARPFRRRLGAVIVLGFALAVITGPADSFVFLYAEDIVHLSGDITAAMVVVAGATGLMGLLLGRLVADRLGRRSSGALGMVGVAVFGAIAYSGSRPALVIGYVLGVFAASVLAPGVGALVNELFPTSVRASASGWWLAASVAGAVVGLLEFGALANVGKHFATAGIITFFPAAALAVLFFALPETRGREPEDLWPTAVANES